MSKFGSVLMGMLLIAALGVCSGCRGRGRESKIFVGRVEEAASPTAALEATEQPPEVIAPPGVGPEPVESGELGRYEEEGGKYSEFMLAGHERYSAGDHKAAAICFLQALGVSKTAEAHYALGKAYRKAGESPSLVIYELERAVEADPKMTDALNDLGVAYFGRRKFKDAEGAFERAAGQKRSARHLSNLGAAHYMLGEYTLALEEFVEALALEPGRPECFWYLAKIYTNRWQAERARHYWKEAVDAYGPASKWGRKGVEELERLGVGK